MFRRLRSPETPAFSAESTVSPGMRIAAAWSWRFLVVAGAIAILIFLVIQLRLLIIPLLIGVLLAALLQPFSGLLQRRLRFPKWLAVITAMLTLLGTVTGLVWLVVSEIRAGYASIEARAIERYDELIVWATDTFGLSENRISDWIANAIDELEIDPDFLLSGALSVGSTAAEVATGAILALFALLFFLIDGPRIWRFIVRLFPKPARVPVDGAGKAGWLTLSNFAKVQIFVAFVDAVGIGLGALILQLPLALPIAVAVFLGSFVPIVGAVVTGALAVFIALVYYDIVIALIMLAIVLLVQQVESNVLQPLVMGQAVKVHPLAVVLAVAAGGFLAGIPGILFAVPIAAVLNVVVRYLASGAWREHPDPELADILPPEPESPASDSEPADRKADE